MLIAVWATGTAPVAGAATDDELAGWLSKAIGPVSELHQAESSALAVLQSDPIDGAELEAACAQLGAANRELQGLTPTPAPPLTVEVQQAIDDFETATQACAEVVAWRPDRTQTEEENGDALYQLVRDVRRALHGAELHLASADTVVTDLAGKR